MYARVCDAADEANIAAVVQQSLERAAHLVILVEVEPRSRVPEVHAFRVVRLHCDDCSIGGALADETHAPKCRVGVHGAAVHAW